MKTLLPLLFLFVTYHSAMATCDKPINDSKVMLFVDTNQSDMEIASASKAACARGEKLVVVPANYKEYTAYINKVNTSMKAFSTCQEKNQYREGTCQTERKSYYDNSQALEDFKVKQKPIKQSLDETLDAINKSKAKLTNVNISGHDGGGSFGGSKGEISRYDVAELMAKYPDINEVESVMLLGCYTGVQKEVMAWKAIFSKVRIIAGYDGSAPLSDRPQGHDYIEDILIKEKQLKALKDPKTLNNTVKTLIDGLGQLNAAMYLHPSCEDEENNEFYYASKIDRNFNKYDVKKCQAAVNAVKAILPQYNKYVSGELEPPKDTAAGELRSIYNIVRTNEHCLDDHQMGGESLGINANQVLFLLFWQGVKGNFAHFYADELAEAEKIISEIDTAQVIKDMDTQAATLQSQVDGIKADIDLMEKDPEGYAKKVNEDLAAATKKVEEMKKIPLVAKMLTEGISNNLSPEEQKILLDFYGAQNQQMDLNFKSDFIKGGQMSKLIESKKATMKMFQTQLDDNRALTQKLKDDPNALNTFFIPNKENLANKSRKEILDNIHNMHKILYSVKLPPKQAAAINWMADAASNHFQYMENPFSWHEYTGNMPEKPSYAPKLAEYIKNAQDNNAGGYAGGMGGGGYVGGGMGGGMNGGMLDGGNGRDSDTPATQTTTSGDEE